MLRQSADVKDQVPRKKIDKIFLAISTTISLNVKGILEISKALFIPRLVPQKGGIVKHRRATVLPVSDLRRCRGCV